MSNTSPIINLAQIGEIELLHRVFGTILVPNAVYEEIVKRGAGQAGASEVQTLD